MKLKDYIKIILDQTDPGIAITFEVNLYSNGEVSDRPTGNKITFVISKELVRN